MRKTVVTGSASGIGRAVAQACRERGDSVIGIDRRDADIIADLSNHEGRNTALMAVKQAFPDRVDTLVTCAGIGAGDGDVMTGVNYFGTVDLAQGLHSLLAASASPRVVAIASTAVMQPACDALVKACLAGDEGSAKSLARQFAERAYASTKQAVAAWVRKTSVADAWTGPGILINAVAPGVVETAMTSDVLQADKGISWLNTHSPMRLGRHAQPEEVARLIAFLGGADNSYMVGQIIFCDGGANATLRPSEI